ncbi:hypothetical protein PAAG_00327 [Paracoccidioides lutzii Pb01]|uniref:DUF1446 domain-containing protein n=1 Tax=Paracoccidioides lutzii (strain ATCC MYA-826 / Pb01) TaxID=502779 RepID=C1GP82_PARBA|nr:hypothetical protein PAAG_00327 [Paracoccidioides lutzii Pb01]EEH36004.2 hypothetical protein PAAG_00327 [Paracoccidioides lutzii Pb01]
MMNNTASTRWANRGQRPVRVANCSGARGDPGYQMLRQATLGDVDFITGDYLAEMNLAEHAEAMAAGHHAGYDPFAWDGIQQSIDAIWEKRIKVIINGGALNPKALAVEVQKLVNIRGYDLKVAYVSGDNLLNEVRGNLSKSGTLPAHLDSNNSQVRMQEHTDDLLDTRGKPVVSANTYLGARAIVKGLEVGADIIICGRVADASPVIGAAWYWHGWKETDYNALAGALIAGHLIECSAYVTGSNFSGFTEFETDLFIDLPFGIVEVEADGSCVVTKHEGTKGIVNVDVVKCQFLYELQGDVYLNSDVKAYTQNILIETAGKDRVRVSGITGTPPPPTTKLAIFYRGGFESQLLINATGYGTDKKWELFEKQIRFVLAKQGYLDKFDFLEFQVVGTPAVNPSSQLKSTTYCRVFAQAGDMETAMAPRKAMSEVAMQHFSGLHLSLDLRTVIPRPYLAFYPALYPQNSLKEAINILSPTPSSDGKEITTASSIPAGNPPKYEPLEPRKNYDTASPLDLATLGETTRMRLGDIALARSGDKGANINFGIFVRSASQWDWFRSFMSREKMRELLGEDDKEYFLERIEFPRLWAVHFVIYGILGRGVSSSTKLDCLGKGFADYVRDKVVEVPVEVLGGGKL